MATTSPDNIWTPDSGDDYALTVDLAATADTIQIALNNRKSNAVTQTGVYSDTGGILNASGVSTWTPITLAGTFKAGDSLNVFSSVALIQNASVSIAGRIRITMNGSDIISRRWHNQGRTGRLDVSVLVPYSLPADVSNPSISVVLESDPSSSGPIEVWNGFVSASIGRNS